MSEKEALERAISIAGSQVKLAQQLTDLTGRHVGQSLISMWLTQYQGRATPRLCRYIESLTGVKASDLRPDCYGELLP
jgi:DNA-binding transcriptional regulator YdaS (Cro superfamily)